jgi:hypothetical protein
MIRADDVQELVTSLLSSTSPDTNPRSKHVILRLLMDLAILAERLGDSGAERKRVVAIVLEEIVKKANDAGDERAILIWEAVKDEFDAGACEVIVSALKNSDLIQRRVNCLVAWVLRRIRRRSPDRQQTV